MGHSLLTLLHQLFKIRPDEAKRAGYAFVYLFACIGAFIMARIARSVLFLEIPNYKDQLPLTYMGIAVTVSVVMYAYARVERRLRRDHTNAVTLAGLVGVTLAFRYALVDGQELTYWAFYIWVEVFGSFLIVQFWSLANEIFHARQAKRLFAVIGGGGVVANIVFGFGTSGAAKLVGTENLLWGIVACLVVCLAMVRRLGQVARVELTTAWERGPQRQHAPVPAGGVFATRHVQLIAGVVVLTYLVSTLVDYQFQVIVGDFIPGKDDRSAYFGAFFGITGILAGFIQFFLTSRLLERFGVLVALLLLPFGMLGGSLGLLLVPLLPALQMAGLTKGAENVLRYTINDSTLQLLYLPLPTHLRGRAKAFIDGVLKPLAVGGAGLMLALLVGQVEKLTGVPLGLNVSVYNLSWLSCALLVAWAVCTVWLKRAYLASLVLTLQQRRLNFAETKLSITDDATVQILGKSLLSFKVVDVLHALELLRFCAPAARKSLDGQVVALLNHVSDNVREAALRYLAQVADPPTAFQEVAIEALLKDSSPGVRAAAAGAVCVILQERAFPHVHRLLDDPSLRVRTHAVAGLVRYGGLDGVLACAEVLKRMLGHADVRERQEAAWILGEVGVQNFYQPLVPLFADREEPVRRAAIVAAGRLVSPGLLPHLLAQLPRPRLGQAAVQALIQYGPACLDAVGAVVTDTTQDPHMRAQACRVLARIGDRRSVDLLCAAIADAAWPVRSAACTALAGILAHHPSLTLDPRRVQAALWRELERAFELLAIGQDLRVDEGGAPLLAEALNHRLSLSKGRVLGLLSLKYSPQTLELVSRNLGSPNPATRANAVEVLDNLLSKEEKARVIPLFDEAPPARVLEAVAGLFALPRLGREDRLRVLLKGGDAWLQCVAAAAVGRWQVADLASEVRDLLTHADPMCRETALVALRELGGGTVAPATLAPLASDPAPAVSRYARFLLRGASAAAS
ncbi:MAG TPA: Npt1/Npt2 family nucleotide transporter [Myxococcota bacterium]|nr:Npt1/Npt2 family nucleotide transporter [Myxococcota bacterium]